LSHPYQNKAALLENILKTLTIFSIETRTGEIQTSDIVKLGQVSISLLASSSSGNNSNKIADENSDPLVKLVKKWRETTLFFDCIPDLRWWQDFFENGFIDREYLKKSIVASELFSATPKWQKLLKHHRSLCDEDFNQIFLCVESEYSNKKYEEVEIVLHITGFFLWLNQLGFHTKTRGKILEEAIKYIDHLKINPSKFTNYGRTNHSYQLGYYNQESEEFILLCNYIDKVNQDLHQENWSNVAKELLDAMQHNHKKFKAMITGEAYWNEDGVLSEQYCDIPVLIYIEPHSFVSQLLAMLNIEQERIFYILEKRYHELYREKLRPELEWLKSIREPMIIESNERKQQGKISGFLIPGFIDKLDEIIESFSVP
jgi:hypothetical protein